MCGGGEDEIGEQEQSRKGEEEERKSKVAVEMDGQEGVESSRVSVAPLYSNRLRHRTSGHSGFDRPVPSAQSLIRQPLSEHYHI